MNPVDVMIALGATLLVACGDPAPARLPTPERSLLEPAIAVATRSTVKVKGSACGLATAGSGVVVADDLVLTAAHVVAGATESQVVDITGEHRAIPVLVDPLTDLAVLYVDDLDGEPVEISDQPAVRGTIGAMLGHPHGGPLEVSTAVVLADYRAQGLDIYGEQRVVRQTLEVEVEVLPGSSGGPLVDSQGALIGMVFGQSEDHPEIGYALTAALISDTVDEAARLTQQGPTSVTTGTCLPASENPP